MQRCGVGRRKGPRVYPILRFTPGDTPVEVSTRCVRGLERLWRATGVVRSVSGRLVAGNGCNVSPGQPGIADDGDDTGRVGGITPLSRWTWTTTTTHTITQLYREKKTDEIVENKTTL